MKPRYQPYEVSPGAWNIRDNRAQEFAMSENAVTMNLTHGAAETIAGILNFEWVRFLRNPF